MLGSKRKVQSVPDNLAQVAEPQERKVTRLGDWLGARAAKPDSYHALQDQDEKKQTAAEFRVVAWNFLAERLTVLQWLPYYDWRSNFFYDLSGGTTIALICLVQTLAHASIATTKVIQGPYCAFVPPFVYAMLGTSPHASISSGAIAAILIADQLRFYDSIEDRTQLASLLAFISGGMLVAMGLLNAAYAVRFLSQSLISGFVTGGSVLIIIGQLKNLFGLVYHTHPIGFLPTVVALVTALPETNFVGLGLGLSMLGLLQVMMWIKKSVTDRLKKKGPHPKWLNPVKILTEMKELVLVGTSIIFAYATTDENGEPLLPVVGWIPQGLPPFQNPMGLEASQDLLYGRHYRLREFMLGGFLVAMTSFLTTYATSKKQALKHGYNIDAAQEMVALGMAGVCGSCFGSFSPSGSLSRTSLASEVGVKTQMSGLMKIVVVGTALKFLTPVLYYLPHATLAAIILRSTWLLVDTKTPRELWREWKPYQQGGMRRDLVVWWTAFLLTIFMGVLYGIGVSVFASLVMIVRDAAMPRVVTLGSLELARGSSVWRDKEVWPEGKVEPGILVAEVRGPLSFASADHFVESIELKRRAESAQQNTIEVVVLALGSVHDLDATAIQTLRELLTEWRLQGVQCIVGDAKSRVRLLMEQNFAQGSKPLLDQPAFMVSLDEAVHLAKRCIAIKALRRGQQNTADGATPTPNHNLSGPALDAESLFLRSASSKFT